ncbi:MAG: thiamine-phosphate kinase [Thermoprotei archaeon]
MKLNELGERRLVRRLTKMLSLPDGVFPSFDDAQAFQAGNDLYSFKIDTFVFSTDRPAGLKPRDVGWKAVTAVASDLAAKGATPYLFLSSLSLPGDTDLKVALEIERGMRDAANAYGGYLIGGDTGEARDGVVAVSAVGKHKSRIFVPRKAQLSEGDVVAVSGNFGYAPLGLDAMLGKVEIESKSLKNKAIRAFRHPVARIELGSKLPELGAKASMDSSDGLAETLTELSRENSVEFVLDRLPADKALLAFLNRKGLSPEHYLLYGGEEYEIIAIFSSQSNLLGTGFKPIGKVASGRTGVFLARNRIREGGYQHFKKRLSRWDSGIFASEESLYASAPCSFRKAYSPQPTANCHASRRSL